MFQENKKRVVTLARKRLERAHSLLRWLSDPSEAARLGGLILQAGRLVVEVEEDLHRLHAYGNAYEELANRLLWAKERLEEALRDGIEYRVRPEAASRILEHANFLERWLQDET